jgi:protein-disulfide isomerase
MTENSHDQTGDATPRETTVPLKPEGTPAPVAYASSATVPATVPGTAPFTPPVLPSTNTLSIVSLITGFFCSIAAVITGHLALNQIRRTGQAGRGLAITGLVLGYLGIGIFTLAVIFAVLFAASIGSFFSSVSSNSGGSGNTSSAAVVASGQVGAANLDDGYLEVGAGRTVVDLYIDPMCPFCGEFDTANGDTLAALVADDSITLRVHPLTFLDSASAGSAYSSRASAALTCEAAINPASTLDYLAAMFAKQPAEGTTGLSDDALVALSTGADSIADCVDSGEYLTWAQQNTENALTGPIEGAEIPSIPGTPTVHVDGSQYTGPIDDPQALTRFIVGTPTST